MAIYYPRVSKYRIHLPLAIIRNYKTNNFDISELISESSQVPTLRLYPQAPIRNYQGNKLTLTKDSLEFILEDISSITKVELIDYKEWIDIIDRKNHQQYFYH